MGSHRALAPTPKRAQDEVLATQLGGQGSLQPDLGQPLQPHHSRFPASNLTLHVFKLPVAPNALCLTPLLGREGRTAPRSLSLCLCCPEGQSACPSPFPGRLLLPLEGIPSCDSDGSFFRKPSFMPLLQPSLSLTPGAAVSGSALLDRAGPESGSAGGPTASLALTGGQHSLVLCYHPHCTGEEMEALSQGHTATRRWNWGCNPEVQCQSCHLSCAGRAPLPGGGRGSPVAFVDLPSTRVLGF